MFYYLILTVAAIGTAGNFALTKLYQQNMGNAARESTVFNMLVGLFSTVIFWIAGGFNIECTPYSLLMAFLMSLFVGIYTMIGFKIMSMGSMTVYTVFLMLGGAVVPFFYGVLFLDEAVTFTNVIALLLVVVAVILNSFEKNTGKQSAKFILLCIMVFLLNGAVSVVSKMHQVETRYPVVSADAFVLLKSAVRFVFFALLIPFCGKKAEQTAKLSVKMYIVMICCAAASGFSYMLQLVAASNIPATILYPIVTGGTIVGTALFDRICFGQHINNRTKISILFCIIALVLFAMK